MQGGVSRPESRYRVVYPENGPRVPSRMSLTAKLLSSPRAMRRLSIACKERPAVIVPATGNARNFPWRDLSLFVFLLISFAACVPPSLTHKEWSRHWTNTYAVLLGICDENCGMAVWYTYGSIAATVEEHI